MSDNQWDRWQHAMQGHRIETERGNVPSGYYKNNTSKPAPHDIEAICIYRDEDGKLQCIRNVFGDGSRMTPDEIEELVASCCFYPISFEIYQAVAENGEPWPEEYGTRLSGKDQAAGVAWTPEYGRRKLGLDLVTAPEATVGPEAETTEQPAAPDWNRHVNTYRAALLATATHDDALACFVAHDVDGLPRDDRGRMETQLDTHRWNLTERAAPENARAVPGANNPPEETPVDAVVDQPAPTANDLSPDLKLAAEASQLAASVKTWLKDIGGKPRNKPEADKLADYGTTLKRIAKSAEDQRKLEKKPVLEQAKEIDAKWDAAKSVAEPAGKYCHDTAEKWRLAENERLADEARAAAKSADQDASLPPAEPPRQITGTGNIRTVSGRTKPVFTVEDPRAFGAYLLSLPNLPPDLIEVFGKLAQKLGAAGIDVPGVTKELARSAA